MTEKLGPKLLTMDEVVKQGFFQAFSMSVYWPKYLILNWVLETPSSKIKNASQMFFISKTAIINAIICLIYLF